ncbi:MAG TPA: regulatory protein RecX [Candidatus Acidoferrum sp.]|nr:regulatory protein RecX [Candidatus Acidoferrum sp.]
MATEDARSLARRAALDLLARREHSLHELFEKVCERHAELDPDEVVRPVLQQLAADNLQSDARFVESWINYRSARGDGPLKISASLQPRKISSAVLKQKLYEEGPDWVELCREALRKKFRLEGKPNASEHAKIQRFLMQRGFTGEQIRAAIKIAITEFGF